jgi:hypothetical protein
MNRAAALVVLAEFILTACSASGNHSAQPLSSTASMHPDGIAVPPSASQSRAQKAATTKPVAGRHKHKHNHHETARYCGTWLPRGSRLDRSIRQKFGKRHECEAIGGAWVITTDPRSREQGSYIGIRVCGGRCLRHVPYSVRSLTWYQPAPRGAEHLAGLNKDGTIFFQGAAGEIAFDLTTRTFTPEKQHS